MTTRPQDVALLPCPFCGLDVTEDEGCFPLNKARTKWEVRCGNPSCFAHDACDESRRAAIARWNRRSDAVLASAQAREDELRAEVESTLACNRGLVRLNEETLERAERLEEALREARASADAARTGYSGQHASGTFRRMVQKIDAALSTNAATQTGETT